MSQTHYIVMSGDHGYTPDYCATHESIGNAVDDLAAMFTLGRDRRRELKRNQSLELRPARDGAEYCEIVECDCNDPDSHNDS